MANASLPRHHSINYVELTVHDLNAAKSFYAQAFGWTFVDYGPTYAGIQDNEQEVGGLSQGDTPQQGGPLVIVFSEHLEATLASIQNAGGTIVQSPFRFPGGRRFHFTDPSGNLLAVWSHE